MIRPATRDDASVIARLERDNLGADAWSEALVEDGVCGGLPTIHYLVAEVEGRIVGYAVASIVADIAELQRIAVDPGHRRAGLASALLDEVRSLASGAGAGDLLLEVRDHNTSALAFYAARGFVEIDRRARYYRDGGTAIVLRRALT